MGYMCLYLIACTRVSQKTVAASRTFREWFVSMNGVSRLELPKSKFTIQDYDLCVLNAPNLKVKHVLTSKKVTVSQAMDYVDKYLPQLIINGSVEEGTRIFVGADAGGITRKVGVQHFHPIKHLIENRIQQLKKECVRANKLNKLYKKKT